MMANATPTLFNILLVSDNDRGSLEFRHLYRYFLSDQMGSEDRRPVSIYCNDGNQGQQFPEENDRFRNKSLLFCIGLVVRSDPVLI